MNSFATVGAVVFAIIAIIHLLFIAGWEIVVTGFSVPVWWSAPGSITFASLALMLWREARATPNELRRK